MKGEAGQFNIYLVDDDPDEHYLFEDAVKRAYPRATLTAINSCEKFIDYLMTGNGNPPNLVFLDINMPRKNGLQCLKEIRQQSKFLDLPIIMYTNSSRTEDIEESYNIGANIFVTKPLSFLEEIALIKKILLFIGGNLL